jgi:hypothetical protein
MESEETRIGEKIEDMTISEKQERGISVKELAGSVERQYFKETGLLVAKRIMF